MLGKPILLTNYDTANSQLNHNVDGYITESSVLGIVSGVEVLYNNEDMRYMLSKKCRESNYSNTRELNKLYQILI